MKKRIITLFLAMSLSTTLCCGCASVKETEAIEIKKVDQSVGSYYLFKSDDSYEYLNFLENFDYENFEIVDISTNMKASRRYSYDELYLVTYKLISDSE